MSEAIYDATADLPDEDGNLPPVHGVDLSSLTQDQLYALYADVAAMLPKHDLRDISAEQELVRQLRAAQALQTATIADRNTPANQKAQIVNSVSGILTALGKLQADVYTSERLKSIELTLVKAVKTLPEDAQRVFFDVYEAMLEGKSA